MNNMRRRILAVVASAVVLIGAIAAGCAVGDSMEVTVKIWGDYLILDKTLTVSGNPVTAGKAVIEACKSEKLAYTQTNGMFDNFAGVASTETDGWLLYVNGEIAQVGALDYKLNAGDTVEFRYENYDTAFRGVGMESYIGKWKLFGDTAGMVLNIKDAYTLSMTYIDAQYNTYSVSGSYTLRGNELIVNDEVSKGQVSIGFEPAGDKLKVTYAGVSLELEKQSE